MMEGEIHSVLLVLVLLAGVVPEEACLCGLGSQGDCCHGSCEDTHKALTPAALLLCLGSAGSKIWDPQNFSDLRAHRHVSARRRKQGTGMQNSSV